MDLNLAAMGHAFFDVRNSLPHFFLTSQKQCLPLSLSYVFVCIARRLGVRAASLNTPGTVCAVLENAAINIAVAFADSEEAIFDTEASSRGGFFSPEFERVNVAQLLLRAVNNISNARDSILGQVARNYDQSVTLDCDAGDETIGPHLTLCLARSCTSVLGETNTATPNAWAVINALFPLDTELLLKDKGLYPTPLFNNAQEDVGNSYRARSPRDDLFVGQIVLLSLGGPLNCIVGFKASTFLAPAGKS